MSRFHFRLEPVLTFRRNRRDQILQLMAELLGEDRNWQAKEDAVTAERALQLDELTQIGQAPKYDVDRAASRRYHAGVLAIDLLSIAQQRALLAEQLDRCRVELSRADQDVKLLEKLKDQQRSEFDRRAEQKAAHEREEAWLGSHWQELAQ